jgi:putative addiction module killer protein
MIQLTDYLTEDGHCPFKDWFADLSDRQAKARILVRLQRLKAGNFGDCKPVNDGIWELKVDHGAGYRIYYNQIGLHVMLLLVGGDKRTQQADIETARKYLKDWKRRNLS